MRGGELTCKNCDQIKDIVDFDRPYVVRQCNVCGREMKIREPGKHGIGIKIDKGDRVTFPAGALQFSANPLKSSSQFSKTGVAWFAELIFGVDLAKKEARENFGEVVERIIESNEMLFRNSELLKGLRFDSPEDAENICSRLMAQPKTVEWWAYMAAGMASEAKRAIEEGNSSEAAWAMAVSERFRSLAVFQSHFAEAVFVGQSAKKLVALLQTWDANKQNSDEGFWQIKFQENAYAISQIFSIPTVFIQDKAYVGGMSIDGKDARLLDFLFAGGSSNDAILVEIKAPTTRLLGARYRTSVFGPSKDLAGSVVQVSDYCENLRRQIANNQTTPHSLSSFNPRRVIIIGNFETQLDNVTKRRSFELFRGSLNNLDVITFDEVFRKIEHLAKLFGLVRKDAIQPQGSAPE
jgi:Domain of unknown function (DUF4263)